eukprot:SAG11_NODE_6436_length_1313_cov_42.749588_1_plen_172_part_10
MLVHRCSNPGSQLPRSARLPFRTAFASVASPGSVRPLPPRRPLRAPRRPRRPVVDRARPARRVGPWPANPATAPELFGTAPFAAPGDPQNSAVLFRTRNLSILQAITCVRRCCTSLGCARALKLFYSNLTSLCQLQIENRIWRVTSDASCVLQKGRNPRAASPAIVCSDTII